MKKAGIDLEKLEKYLKKKENTELEVYFDDGNNECVPEEIGKITLVVLSANGRYVAELQI